MSVASIYVNGASSRPALEELQAFKKELFQTKKMPSQQDYSQAKSTENQIYGPIGWGGDDMVFIYLSRNMIVLQRFHWS